MGGLPNDADAKKVIRVLKKEFGWIYDDDVAAAAHPCGWLRCGDGCVVVVYKTGNNSAKKLWSTARKCPHGHAPARQHW